mmetsp:Transcript_35421/g.89450  ORF Transcript_35421/g.89450 Transcript_35421/m.89450 type:complete len:247 (-) Transcript_35421:450-1190(-)
MGAERVRGSHRVLRGQRPFARRVGLPRRHPRAGGCLRSFHPAPQQHEPCGRRADRLPPCSVPLFFHRRRSASDFCHCAPEASCQGARRHCEQGRREDAAPAHHRQRRPPRLHLRSGSREHGRRALPFGLQQGAPPWGDMRLPQKRLPSWTRRRLPSLQRGEEDGLLHAVYGGHRDPQALLRGTDRAIVRARPPHPGQRHRKDAPPVLWRRMRVSPGEEGAQVVRQGPRRQPCWVLQGDSDGRGRIP